MSLPPEYTGKFSFYSETDNFLRTYHLWVSYDPIMGEVESIFIGVTSTNLLCANGPLRSKDCVSSLEKAAWRIATARCAKGMFVTPAIDDNVIEEWD